MKFFRYITSATLRTAERFYLWAHGWHSLPGGGIHGRYTPPKDYPLERKHDFYVRVHAVNAQRQVYAKVTKDHVKH